MKGGRKDRGKVSERQNSEVLQRLADLFQRARSWIKTLVFSFLKYICQSSKCHNIFHISRLLFILSFFHFNVANMLRQAISLEFSVNRASVHSASLPPWPAFCSRVPESHQATLSSLFCNNQGQLFHSTTLTCTGVHMFIFMRLLKQSADQPANTHS